MDYRSWSDVEQVRAHLAAGVDPNEPSRFGEPPIFAAAETGTPEAVAELVARVADVDAICNGHTALWAAVFHGKPGNARVLVEAGADPYRPMMAGWSPAKLSLAGPTPDLFPQGDAALSPEEAAAVARSHDVIAALESIDDDGHSIACVAGVTAAEAMRRLGGTLVTEEEMEPVLDDPFEYWFDDEWEWVFGVTDVPGGCVIMQPFGFRSSDPGLLKKVSEGTRCYAMFANPKSGNQGACAVDGEIVDWDTHPGYAEPFEDDTTEDNLPKFLYHGHAEAFCCGYAGLHLTDDRAVVGPPDFWMRIPPTE
ncbi:ankyrin repeat domain-containing protein [Herbidospora sp. RD11066]